MTIEFSVRLIGAIRHDDEADVFVSYCPALKLFSQGETEPEAKAALEGAVKLFITACFERGQLDSALRQCGFTRATDIIPVENRVSEYIQIRELHFGEVFDLDVPISLLAAQHQAAHVAVCQPQ